MLAKLGKFTEAAPHAFYDRVLRFPMPAQGEVVIRSGNSRVNDPFTRHLAFSMSPLVRSQNESVRKFSSVPVFVKFVAQLPKLTLVFAFLPMVDHVSIKR